MGDHRKVGSRAPYNTMLKRAGELYTPKTEAYFKLLDEVRLQCGGPWKNIAREARLSTRVMRDLRGTEIKTVSLHVMDKLLSRTGFPQRVEELEWLTPEELVERGIWKPHNTSGLVKWKNGKRVRGHAE